MLGKITNALVRREADTYLMQGLHEEALSLFKAYLNSSPTISPDIKAAVERQIRQIEKDLKGTAVGEHQKLSQDHITIIREGWCENATADDLMVCAKSFHTMGFHSDALLEYKKLVRNGFSLDLIIGPIADCLARLHPPEDLVKRVDHLAGEMFHNPADIFSFKLSLAEKMVEGQNIPHALALGRHLAEYTGVPKKSQLRFDTLVKALLSAKAALRLSKTQEQSASTVPIPPRSAFLRIWDAFTSLACTLRNPKHKR